MGIRKQSFTLFRFALIFCSVTMFRPQTSSLDRIDFLGLGLIIDDNGPIIKREGLTLLYQFGANCQRYFNVKGVRPLFSTLHQV